MQELDLHGVARPVIDLLAAAAAADQSALRQRTQMVRDCGARHVEQRRDIDDALLPVAEQPEDAHPGRVAQLLENVAYRAEVLHIFQLPVQLLRVSVRAVVVRKGKLRHSSHLLYPF